MYEHFCEKFPEQVAEIRLLARLSDAVRSILDDYEELCTWLASQKQSGPRNRDELEQAQTLARDLEHEILKQLEQQDDSKT